MTYTNYKVTAWGPPLNVGATGASWLSLSGVAKTRSPTNPFILVNELVCNAMARCLLLPCPPGALVERAGDPWFFSLDFNLAGHALPPADPAAIVAQDPRLAWGIILFDSFVMNHDRHDANIAHDMTTKRVQIFDHSHAFLRGGRGDVHDTLARSDGRLCIGGHCLASEVNDIDGLSMWVDRINSMPDFFIEGVIGGTVDYGLPPSARVDCVDFMKKRRSEIGKIVFANIASFPKLPRTLMP